MKWNIDASHTSVEFSIKHLMISNVKGRFHGVTGTVDLDPADNAKNGVDVSIDVSTIDTRDEKRDGHLVSPDFFDVATYPTITYKSTKVEKSGENDYKVTGDLTIHGVTQPVVLEAEFTGEATDPWGNKHAAFTATTSINRKDFGLNWNVALEAGGMLVGDKIKVELDVELLQAPVAASV